MRLLIAFSVFLILGAIAARAQPDADGRWRAGVYSFSDELGGFRITGISGQGTEEDPAVVSQEITGLQAATLVVRALVTLKPYVPTGHEKSGFLFLRLITVNGSGHPWIAYDMELQEKLHRPSVFGDGLSFDQLKYSVASFGSDHFVDHVANFEPYDKLTYRKGHVDPQDATTFGLLITDFTPRSRFFLRQDPVIPMF